MSPHAAAWNPQLAEMAKQAGTHLVYDSSQIPGEILDVLAINTATLEANPEFAKALTGAWFETVALMTGVTRRPWRRGRRWRSFRAPTSPATRRS